MRGVCADSNNPANRPTPWQLAELGADGVRLVYQDTAEFEDYYQELQEHGFQVAVVLAGESFPDRQFSDWAGLIAAQLASAPPAMYLLGNEPAATRQAASSWAMSPPGYLAFWNQAAWAIRATSPEVPLYVGGMLGSAGWLDPIWSEFSPAPDGIDVHYPASEGELVSWNVYGAPLACMEWCWSGPDVRTQQVVLWQQMLAYYCGSTCWFCWGWDETMSLVSPTTGEPLPAYWNYASALHAL